MTGAKTRPTPGVLSQRATTDATALLTADDARLYRSCVGALMYFVLGAQNAYVKLRIQNDDPITVELVGYSDSDWAGDPSSRKSQSSGHVEADGCPLTSCSRRQNCVATSSGMAEYYAMCSTAEELLNLRTILEHFGIQSEQDQLLRLSGCARHCPESWIGECRGAGGENVMVARGCSRERATDQSRLVRRETRLTLERKCCRWRG